MEEPAEWQKAHRPRDESARLAAKSRRPRPSPTPAAGNSVTEPAARAAARPRKIAKPMHSVAGARRVRVRAHTYDGAARPTAAQKAPFHFPYPCTAGA